MDDRGFLFSSLLSIHPAYRIFFVAAANFNGERRVHAIWWWEKKTALVMRPAAASVSKQGSCVASARGLTTSDAHRAAQRPKGA